MKAIVFAVLVALAVTGSAVNSEQAARITAEPQTNAFFSEYELLDGHPDCNDAGQVAYRIDHTLNDLNFRVFDTATGAEQFVGDQYAGQCVRTVRRGTQVQTFEVPCDDANTSATNTMQFDPNTKLEVTVTADICLSPISHRVIAGTWSSSVSENGTRTTRTGQITTLQTNNFVSSRKRYENQAFWLQLQTGRDVERLWADYASGFTPIRPLHQQSVIFGVLECLPYSDRSASTRNLVLEAPFLLIPVNEPREACRGSDCLILDESRVFKWSRARCDTPSW